MLQLTEAARSALAEILARSRAGPDVLLRFVEREESFELLPATVQQGDQVFEHDGRAILALDEDVAERLADRTLDAAQRGENVELRLMRRTT